MDAWGPDVADYFNLREVGRLCAATGLTHSEINAMDAERVHKLIAMNEARKEWLMEE